MSGKRIKIYTSNYDSTTYAVLSQQGHNDVLLCNNHTNEEFIERVNEYDVIVKRVQRKNLDYNDKKHTSIVNDVYNRIKDDLFWNKITKQNNILTPSKAVAFIYCLKGVHSKDVGEIFACIATLYPDSFETQMDGKSILLKKVLKRS